MNIEFTLLSEHGRAPTRAHSTDAGYDLYAGEECMLLPNERASVGTGIALAIPAGHAGLVLPRSGLAMRDGITIVNSPGLIDPDYRGEVRVLMLNTDSNRSFSISVGDRIAQLVVTKVAAVEFVERKELVRTARGQGGFGSTGVR